MNHLLLDQQLRSFLEEDLEHGDITTDAIFSRERGAARFVARHSLVACGMEQVAVRIFTLLGGELEVGHAAVDGRRMETGAVLLKVRGSVRTLLRGERVALNLVQHLCGIASLTADFVEEVQGLPVRIVDTRKTKPGLRMLEKYAVRCGGGHNHRYSLSDGALIKDNHIAACGTISEAVRRVRARIPHTMKVEVETDTLEQVEECLHCGVEIIMLDNMDVATMTEAVRLIGGKAVTEASGGVSLARVRAVAETGVDIISVGSLTHSAPACDIGLDWEVDPSLRAD